MKKFKTFKKENLTIADGQDLFEKDLDNRDLRKATKEHYKWQFNSFYRFANYKEPITTIDKEFIEDYIKHLQDRGLSPRTVETNTKGIMVFCKFLMKEGFIEPFTVKIPRSRVIPKDMYSQEEILILLKKPRGKYIFSELMTWCAINCLALTGMRSATLCNMKIKDIDFDNKTIFYRHTKNKQKHLVPLPTELEKVLKTYLGVRVLDDTTEEDNLIVNAYGNPINSNNLYKYVAKYNKERGVKSVGLHSFRRFYIKSLVQQGVPIIKIQHLVQHSSPSLVALYSKIYSEDLVKDVETFSDNLLNKNRKKKRF